MVPDLITKFEMICLGGTKVIEQEPNLGCMYLRTFKQRYGRQLYGYKTDRHNLNEILLKVGLNSINQTKTEHATYT